MRVFPASLLVVALCLAAAGCQRERAQLLQDVKSDRPEVRAGALHRLGELADPQDLGLFITKSADHSAKVRRASAEAMAHLPQLPRATDALSTLLGDPDEEVQAQAAQSLAAIGSEKARAYLTSSFSRRGSATRAAIATALGMGPLVADAIRKEADSIHERNLKALDDGSSAEKVGAAEELGRSGRSDAVERLLPLLGNDSILLAAGAARGLGAAGDRKAVPPLMAVLRQNDPPLREASAQALGELGDPQALSVLGPLAASSDAAASDAAVALTKFPASPEANQALCKAASESPNPTAVAAAIRAMTSRGGCPLPPLIARLGKTPAESRLALMALEKLGASAAEASAKIAPLLEDKDQGVRLAAASALGALGGPPAVTALTAFVKSGLLKVDRQREKWVKEPMPKEYAPGIARGPVTKGPDFGTKFGDLAKRVHDNDSTRAEEAGQLLHAAKAEALPEIVPDTVADEIKLLAEAEVALGRAKAPDAQLLLSPRITDPDDDLRTGAATGLAYVGGPAALKAVQSTWADLSPEAVEKVAGALRSVGPEAVPVLLNGLVARDADRGPIALALAELKSTEAEPALEKLLLAGGTESSQAATAVATLAQPGAAKVLANVLHDSRFTAPLEAVQALGTLKDPEGREALTRQLFNEQTAVRTAAVQAIAALGVGPSATALEALRGDYYREVRHAVEQALGAAPSGH